MYADNLAMQIIRAPGQFDVIVGENTFGDIISDEAAVLAGSLGMLPSASLAALPQAGAGAGGSSRSTSPSTAAPPTSPARASPTPVGMVLSTAMMLRYSLGMDEEADAVEHAVDGVLAEGYRTPDIAATAATWWAPPAWAT